MKASDFILFLTIICYVFCLIDINDINLSTEFILDTKEYPNNIIPNDSTFYFRMETTDIIDKLIQFRAEEKDSFIVKIATFEEKPEIEDVEGWNKLELQLITYDFKHFIHHYHLRLEEKTKYILISVTLKYNLTYLSIYIKNNKKDEIVSYKAKYFNKYKVNLIESKSQYPRFVIELTESHIGEIILNFFIKHKDNPVNFKQLFAYSHKNKEKEDYKNEEDVNIDIELNDVIISNENDVYKYMLDLKNNSTYTIIGVELDKKIDFSFYIDYPKEEKVIPLYNVEYSRYYKIDMNTLIPSENTYLTLKSTEKHVGDTYIKLKVKKGVLNDTFNLVGYGTKEYVNTSKDENSVDLNIKYDNIFHKDLYDIVQYYFEAKEETGFFTINIYIYKNIEYLSILVDSKSVDKFDLMLFIIIFLIIMTLTALLILHIKRKKKQIIKKLEI